MSESAALNLEQLLAGEVGAPERVSNWAELGGDALRACGDILRACGVTCDASQVASFAEDFQHGVTAGIDQSVSQAYQLA